MKTESKRTNLRDDWNERGCFASIFYHIKHNCPLPVMSIGMSFAESHSSESVKYGQL